MDWNTLADPRTLSLAGVFLLALVGGYRGWWQYGPTHREIVQQWRERCEQITKDRDAWRQIALNVTGTAEKLADVAKQVK